MLLLRVKLRQLQSRHVVDEEVVTNLTVGEDALLVCLGDPLGEDAGVLGVEEQVDASEFTVLAVLVVPDAAENVTFGFVRIN